ncbi:MAG TPA: ketopantoate reductase family protein [Sphaerochaeta sp.]|nr:ketopantoate reductase family protein [Sphaerochaeta sp.]
MKKITIIGCGAVGALYGLRLHRVLGSEGLAFLVDEGRRERYGREGVIVNGERAPFRFITASEAEVQDLVIVATKNHHLEDAIAMMRPLVGAHTTILSLLNGIESEEELSAAFGPSHVLYGFCVGLNSTHTGNAITYTAEGRIVFGERDNTESERVRALSALFSRAGIASQVPDDIMVALYNKFMLNTAYNTISALLGATYRELDKDAVWRLAKAVSAEVQAVAKREGVILPDSLVEENHQIVISLGEGKTSMAQDMEAGRVTENAWFCGTVIKLGLKHAIPTPVASTLSALVEARER